MLIIGLLVDILARTGASPVVNIGKQGELTDGNGRYWVAVGPKVTNPNYSGAKRITESDMNYGVKLDVVVSDKNGVIYYIPCVVGDAKAHTSPNGIFQTEYGFPGEQNYPNNNDSSIIEFMGNGSITGLTAYDIINIIVYDK